MNSFLVLFLVTFLTFIVSYIILFGIWQGTYKSDWFTLYNINVFVARKFNDLRLLVNIVFKHPPGPKWTGGQEKAQPLKLIFTDQSKVSTSAGARDSHWEKADIPSEVTSCLPSLLTTLPSMATTTKAGMPRTPYWLERDWASLAP